MIIGGRQGCWVIIEGRQGVLGDNRGSSGGDRMID